MKLFVFVLIVLLFVSPAYAGIVSPVNNEEISSEFYVTVSQANATTIDAKLVGYSWQALEKIGTDTFAKQFMLSDYPAGDYILSVRYTNENMNVLYFSPVKIKIVKSTPTPTPGVPSAGNMTVVGFTSGNYSNQTKMWVSVMDSKNASSVSATIAAYNPGLVASWVTQNGLTKVDLTGLTPDSYLIKVTAANYLDVTFFMNVTPPPLPKITVEGFKDAVEAGNIITLLFTPAEVNVSLLQSNGTYIKRVFHNSTEYKLNTANLAESSYKLRAEKDGYEVWTGVFFVADMSVHPPAVTPTPTPTVTPCYTLPETGRCVSAEARDAFYVGYKMNPTTTPTPTPTATPATISGNPQPQGDSGYIPYLALIVIIGVGGYVYKRERGQDLKPAPGVAGVTVKDDSFEKRIAETITPAPVETIQAMKTPLKCPHCTFAVEVVLPLGTPITPELVQMYLAKHIKDEHTEKE